MPQPSLPAPSALPSCLSSESAKAWAQLRNYVRLSERRLLLVIQHDSPRLPRELPTILAAEFNRQLISAQVSDAEPDPMAAALRAVPEGHFPSGCLLSISGAEDLDVTSDDSRDALYQFARRLDLRRDQFLPEGGIVIVWANARVYAALAKHSLNFISMAASVALRAAAPLHATTLSQSSIPVQSLASYHLPPLPADAPADLQAALAAFGLLAVANERYLAGGPAVAHALADFDSARDEIEAGWASALHHAELGQSGSNPTRHFARALVLAYPDAGVHLISLRFHPRQWIVWLEAQVQAAHLLANRAAEGNALGNLGNAHFTLGNARKAIEFYEKQLVIAREIGARRSEGNALGGLGNAHFALGDARKAIEYHEQALVVIREIGDRRADGSILGNLGNAHAALGDARKAIEFYEKQLVIVREIGDRRGEGQALGNLGVAHKNLGDARKAIEFYERCLLLHREIGDRRAEGQDLGNLGSAYAVLGDVRKAVDFYEQQLVIACEIGDLRGKGNALYNSALSLEKLADRTQAVTRAKAALAIYEAIEDPNAAKARRAITRWEAEG